MNKDIYDSRESTIEFFKKQQIRPLLDYFVICVQLEALRQHIRISTNEINAINASILRHQILIDPDYGALPQDAQLREKETSDANEQIRKEENNLNYWEDDLNKLLAEEKEIMHKLPEEVDGNEIDSRIIELIQYTLIPEKSRGKRNSDKEYEELSKSERCKCIIL